MHRQQSFLAPHVCYSHRAQILTLNSHITLKPIFPRTIIAEKAGKFNLYFPRISLLFPKILNLYAVRIENTQQQLPQPESVKSVPNTEAPQTALSLFSTLLFCFPAALCRLFLHWLCLADYSSPTVFVRCSLPVSDCLLSTLPRLPLRSDPTRK